ncbi:MAG: glutamyl-tRNA reductase [Deltaproteobacteria bacterium]|nr:glutamyl-tRNA reductase [Deltaproteobacteria bacterium]
MNIVLVGLNHKTAALALREKLNFNRDDIDAAYQGIISIPSLTEGIYISTCNRVELMATTEEPVRTVDGISKFLSNYHGVKLDEFTQSLYVYRDRDTVKHLFEVASSLDSMILGEPHILGQIKVAYRQAVAQGASGVILNRLLHKAFSVAKRVRTETGICSSAVSVSYAAVELAKKIFGQLKGKKALLVGAGEMAELAAEHLLSAGVAEITIANRTLQNAVTLAKRFHGQAASLSEIPTVLQRADIVITSTGAEGFVIGYDDVKGMMRQRKNRPIFFIDIAVPRDVEPSINTIGNVYVYDIDDLKGIIESNKSKREEEAIKACRIIDEEVLKFENWVKTLDVVPTIRGIKDKLEAIRKAELDRSQAVLKQLSPDQVQAINVLTESLVKKVLHDPVLYLKLNGHRQNRQARIDQVRKVFNLDREIVEQEIQIGEQDAEN